MPADIARLVGAAIVPGVASEMAKQINAGVGNRARLVEAGMVPALATEVVAQIGTSGNVGRLIELGLSASTARQIVVQISGGVTPTPTPAIGGITVAGDSIPAGQYSTPSSYVAVNMLGYGSGVTILNKAVAGESMQTEAQRFQNRAYDAGIVATGPSVLVIEGGTNDLANFGGNISETALYTILTNLVAVAKANGFWVVVCTLLPRTVGGVDSWSSTQEAKRIAYNNLIRNNAAGADAVMDQAANSIMGDAANSTTNTALYVDGLHPTNAGQDALVPTWRTAINLVMYNAARPATLGPLSLSTALIPGTASSGTIAGARAGSVITANVAGLTVNSAARTFAWDGTGVAGTTANGLVETLAGATGSPRPSSVSVTGTNFVRLTNLTRLAESAGASGGYDYTPTVSVTAYTPVAAGYTTVTLPANTDGWLALPIPVVGRDGPIIGFTTVAAPSGYADVGIGIYADIGGTNGTGKYLYIVNGVSSFGNADPTPITIEVNDIMRVRRAGTTGYLEVSKNGGTSYTVAKTLSLGTQAYKLFIQTGTQTSPGIIRAPFASASVV